MILPDFSKLSNQIQERNEKNDARAEENTQLLKEIVNNQKEQILNQEVIIDALAGQLKSANHTLDLILNSLGTNSQKTQISIEKNSKLLLELQQILIQEQLEQGSGQLIKFIEDHSFDAIAVILQLISITMGKS